MGYPCSSLTSDVVVTSSTVVPPQEKWGTVTLSTITAEPTSDPICPPGYYAGATILPISVPSQAPGGDNTVTAPVPGATISSITSAGNGDNNTNGTSQNLNSNNTGGAVSTLSVGLAGSVLAAFVAAALS
ncbi:hypothetical protein CVT24_010891 [Panaeolus cyanescens]|uniref:Uncharacterized protein n=1 Tax=Panaeolus cyanescens TaxID=181874 RepID=A0A409X142_9AGAR|nr:hypothetical protein CVT24_010891 [Panaeolus cyanescens]